MAIPHWCANPKCKPGEEVRMAEILAERAAAVITAAAEGKIS
ncbi:hypothetical protein ATN83_0911 [Raoultella ornithinolytica]|jgi:hypothetical protein|nr:hypothetical protein ATN83_0911 [Raoultella ornithinolytica]KDV92243.1 hypothetical protein AB00_3956 [Raoultella ornithinolytica 2-156-04_S1_C1]KDX12716.1 hypothetical protein AB28_3961 [Raoultella ornithinolytica 2-156-04_S1_C2]